MNAKLTRQEFSETGMKKGRARKGTPLSGSNFIVAGRRG